MEEIKSEEVKTQDVEPIIGFILWHCIKAIAGYITLYFFRPAWAKLMDWCKIKPFDKL
jgi:hypothetical protein